MFAVWCEHPSVCHVAEVCKVSPTTAKKYRDVDNWTERFKKVRKKTSEKIDAKIALTRSKLIETTEWAIVKVVNEIKSGGMRRSKSLVTDLDKLIRLNMELKGDDGADAGPTRLRFPIKPPVPQKK